MSAHDAGRLAMRRGLLVGAGLAAAWPLAEWLRPRHRSADARGTIDLQAQVPTRFGDWSPDASLRPLLPDPALQAQVDATYTQVLARAYRFGLSGGRVMLSIAYGNDQASEATAVHRPEFCYRAQGFEVADMGVHPLSLADRALKVRRLLSRLGPHREPISYWVTLDETATLPGPGRKWQQLRHGLAGIIADGMLVRISSLGLDPTSAFAWHERFAAALCQAMAPDLRARYFGRGTRPEIAQGPA